MFSNKYVYISLLSSPGEDSGAVLTQVKTMSMKETNTKKTILRVALAAAVVLLLCGAAIGGVAGATGSWSDDVFTPNTGGYTTAQAFANEINTGSHSSAVTVSENTVTLNENIVLGGTLKIGDGNTETTIVLNLNDKVLSRSSAQGTANFSVITVASKASLTLTDSDGTKTTRYFNKDATTGLWMLAADQATPTGYSVTGGCITGGTGTLNPKGTYSGGGVYVAEGGTFNMTGGNIVGNSATWGGGVYVNGDNSAKGKFTMTGGNITGNSAIWTSSGVGVNVDKGTFEMSGGSITNNTAANGGGVYVVHEGSTFNVSGTPKIIGNTNKSNPAKPNNVYLVDGRTITLVKKTGSDNTSLETGAEIRIIYPLDTTKSFATGSDSHTVTANDAKFFFPDRDPDKYLAAVTDSTSPVLGWVAPTVKLETKTADSTVTTYYATVADAVANAKTGDGTTNQVTMLKDSTESTVTLDLHGCVLKGTGSGSVISVSSTGNMTVTDSKPNSEHHFYKNSTPWVWDSTENSGDVVKGGCITGGTLNMTGGNIVGNKATLDNSEHGGGGVCLNGGTFTMSGNALVVGNQSPRGGGVRVNQGTFNMSGGSISGNTAQYSGGVYLGGGSISGNKADDPNGASGGGVGVNSSAKFEMSGGSIKNNTAPTGGGVLVMRSSTFNMSGNAIIEGNEATGDSVGGGGVRVLDTATFSMSDTASIINNTSARGGGGVYVENGTFSVSGTPVISGNTKSGDSSANNVCLASGKTITVTEALGDGADIRIVSPDIQDDPLDTGSTEYTVKDSDAQHSHADSGTWIAVVNPGGAEYANSKLVWGTLPENTHMILTNPAEHGYITASPATASKDTQITVTCYPDAGYQVSSLTYTVESGTSTSISFTDNTGTFIMPDENVTVNASFTANTYTVTLNAQDGTGGSYSVKATYGAAMPSATMPTKSGYTFNGYFNAQSGGKQYYNADGSSANNWDKTETEATLYAQWTANTYTITYKDQDDATFSGTHETGYPTTHTYGTDTSLKTATKTGYTFNGWFTD